MIEVIFFIAMVAIVVVMLVAVPALTITIPTDVASTLISICQVASYLLPIKLLMPLVLFSFTFNTFRFLWSVFVRVKSFIPTGGSS